MANKKKTSELTDYRGHVWATELGDLKVGSKFFLYGDELCEVLEIDHNRGSASVLYKWGDKTHQGLPPIQSNAAWCSEKE